MKRCFGLLLVLALMLSAFSLRSEAATETYGNCGETMTWRFDTETGTLVISGSGSMYKFTESSDTGAYSVAPWKSLPIKAVKVGENVTGLCRYAFTGQDELTQCTLPSTLTSLPLYAFENCIALKEITLPENLTSLGYGAFEGCTALESIDLSHVATVGNYCFSGCTALKDVTMPETAVGLYAGCFYNCTSLAQIELPEGITSVSSSSFAGCPLSTVVIPEGVTAIYSSAFRGCTQLQTVSLPISLKTVDNYAFQNCTALETVYYPGAGEDLAGVSISSGNDPLLNARWEMIGVTAPDAMIRDTEDYTVTLDWEPVEGAESYEIWHSTSRYINYSLVGTTTDTEFIHTEPVKASYNYYKVRAWDADSGTCSNWSELMEWFCLVQRPTDNVCGDDMTWAYDETTGLLMISGNGEMYDYLSKDENRNVISVSPWGELPFTGVVFEGNITGIGEGAFMNCMSLQQLELPDTVTSIGKYLCTYCPALTSVKLPEQVSEFDMEAAFRNCSSLTAVKIPEGKTDIGAYAFQNCTALERVEIPSGLTAIGSYAFNGCSSLTDFVIPYTLTSLGGSAFYGCENLTSVVIPGSISTIPVNCFRSCTLLKTVKLPVSVTTVDANAFYACDSMTDVYYGGTPADREGITFGSGNLELENALWEYSYPGALPAPVVTVSNKDDGNVRLKIEKDAGAVYCEIAKATAPEGPYTVVSAKTKSTNYTVKNLEYGVEYYFRVRALDTDTLAGSEYSNPVSGYRKLPEGKITVTMSCNGETAISWSAVDQAVGYEIWRGTTGYSNIEKLAETTELTYTDIPPEPDTSYYYSLVALHSNPECHSSLSPYVHAYASKRPEHSFGEWEQISAPSVYAHGEERRECSTCGTVETNILEALKPEAPVVKASGNAGTGKPKLSWKAVEGATCYRIYRATSKSGTYSYQKSTRSLSYTDTSAKAGTNYYYKVLARNEDTEKNSAYSNTVNRCCDLKRPVVTLKVDTASGKPKVTFEKISGAEKYYIVRSTSKNGTYSKVATITGTSYIDKTAKAGKTYYYKVKALHEKDAADSAYSTVTSRVCDLAKPVVSITRKNGDPRLTWDKISGAEKYYVYRATSKTGTYTKVKTTVTATSFTDTSVKAGKTYYYKVMAIHSNSAANSAWSAVKSITAK